jgi:catechol 2,3-dioxygenase-like lactoylglutathione lyase family enzyme
MELKLGHFEIFVREPVKTGEFYQQILGFELDEIQAGKYVWLNKNNVTVLLRPGNPKNESKAYQQTSIAMVMYSEDAEQAVRELKEKGVEFKGDDGPGCYTFCDPEGNWIQLVKPQYS